MRLRTVMCGLVVALLAGATAAWAMGEPAKLTVTFIDVEGGQSTLFVTPDGHSLLIDTGWDDHDGRDADRIVAAAHKLGLKKIEYVLITHFHDDHVGGVPNLVQRIPVGTFIDHGPNREHGGKPDAMYAAYIKMIADGHYGHLTPKPGDVLPIEGMHVQVVSQDATTLTEPLPGAGEENKYCPAAAPEPDVTENQRSLGTLITFGKLRILDLGDLTKDMEYKLMCPVNRIGTVDVLVVSHHGWYMSSSPALVDAIRPRVSIMDNGETKGGSTPVLDTLAKVPGLEARWQLHYSDEGGEAHNTNKAFIANLSGEPDKGNSIVVTGERDGSFQVLNTRTGYMASYAAGVRKAGGGGD